LNYLIFAYNVNYVILKKFNILKLKELRVNLNKLLLYFFVVNTSIY